MGKLLVTTLAGMYMVMIVAGKPLPGAPDQTAAQAQPVQTADASAPNPDPLYAPAKIVAKAAQGAQVQQAALITPAQPKSRMPGPALKPSPEHRAAATPAKLDGGTLWTVDASALNVRSGPSTSNGTVDSIRRGEQVLVVAEQGGWAHVTIEGDGVDGWVAKRYLSPAN